MGFGASPVTSGVSIQRLPRWGRELVCGMARLPPHWKQKPAHPLSCGEGSGCACEPHGHSGRPSALQGQRGALPPRGAAGLCAQTWQLGQDGLQNVQELTQLKQKVHYLPERLGQKEREPAGPCLVWEDCGGCAFSWPPRAFSYPEPRSRPGSGKGAAERAGSWTAAPRCSCPCCDSLGWPRTTRLTPCKAMTAPLAQEQLVGNQGPHVPRPEPAGLSPSARLRQRQQF